MVMASSQLYEISRPNIWVKLQYRDLTSLIIRFHRLRAILVHQDKAGFSGILLATAYSDTSSRYNFFISLGFTWEVSPSILFQHSSQSIVVLRSFRPEGVSVYALSVIIAWPLVQWSKNLSSIWYKNPSLYHCTQRFYAMVLADNYSTAPLGRSTLYSLVSRSGFSL